MKNSATVVYCSWGSGIALGVSGDRGAVEKKCNQFYNYNATDSAPIWQNDNQQNAFAYVLTNWERLEKAYTDMFIAGFLSNKRMAQRRFKGGFIKLAQEKARQRCETIKMEQFLSERPSVNIYQRPDPYKTISHESLPSTYTED